MTKSSNGLVPAQGFLESCMATRPTFNDEFNPSNVDVSVLLLAIADQVVRLLFLRQVRWYGSRA